MIKISHRGNYKSINPERENTVSYINEALVAGFHVELDLWWYKDGFYLGHDEPKEPVELDFLNNSKFFIHCKNLAAYNTLSLFYLVCDVFFHDKDPYALTKNGKVWGFPNKDMDINYIAVDLKNELRGDEDIFGICKDIF